MFEDEPKVVSSKVKVSESRTLKPASSRVVQMPLSCSKLIEKSSSDLQK